MQLLLQVIILPCLGRDVTLQLFQMGISLSWECVCVRMCVGGGGGVKIWQSKGIKKLSM